VHGLVVHEVLGHMTATATMTPLGFVGRMARAGFRFETMARRNIDAETAGVWVPETSLTDADQVIHRRGCQSMIRRWRRS
jgi:hypothetical protein